MFNGFKDVTREVERTNIYEIVNDKKKDNNVEEAPAGYWERVERIYSALFDSED